MGQLLSNYHLPDKIRVELLYVQLYLAIKSHLKDILPSNFFPRLIMANNARHHGKHGYVVQLRTPTRKVLMNRRDLLHYCQEHNINFMHFKHLKFRYYLKNYDFQPASEMQLKDKYRILFKYTKQILSDHKNGVFSHRCCNKQFCQKEAFDQHRSMFHSNTIRTDNGSSIILPTISAVVSEDW